MIYLLLSILCATAVVLVFKWFATYGVRTFPAIVINYLVCVGCAWAALGRFPVRPESLDTNWFPYALALGFVFIGGFIFTGKTVQQFSITLASVMAKMSLVLTVSFTIIFYRESIGFFKVSGILAALLAILFTNVPQKKGLTEAPPAAWMWLYPALTLLTSATIEIVLFHVEQINETNADLGFIAFIFGTAGLIGLVVLAWGGVAGASRLSRREWLGGLALGIPNFGSIYFLLKTIGIGWEGSVVFPVNNVAVIGLSAVLAAWWFRERLSKINTLGVLLAMLAIVLIALS